MSASGTENQPARQRPWLRNPKRWRKPAKKQKPVKNLGPAKKPAIGPTVVVEMHCAGAQSRLRELIDVPALPAPSPVPTGRPAPMSAASAQSLKLVI
jgi:hypothetical protein